MNKRAMDPPRAGASLTGTSVEQISQNINTWRNVTIQITNHSRAYTLANPKIHTTQGYSFHPPQPTIEKNTIEVCCFSKTSGAARGAIGVLTYQILTDENRSVGDLAIMFSVPFDYNWFKNWFALGLYDKPTTCDNDLFYQMYYANGPFTRSEGKGDSVSYSGRDCVVKGTMSSFGQCILKVEFWDL